MENIDTWILEDMKRRDKRMGRVSEKRVKRIALVVTLVLWAIIIAVTTFVDIYLDDLMNTPFVKIAEASIEEKHHFTYATVTAYTSSVDETDDTPFITASGERTSHGTIACPNKYSFGTVVVIEGRQYNCNDRMNRRYREQDRFDIWVETKAEAFEWGVKQLTVKVLAIN